MAVAALSYLPMTMPVGSVIAVLCAEAAAAAVSAAAVHIISNRSTYTITLHQKPFFAEKTQ